MSWIPDPTVQAWINVVKDMSTGGAACIGVYVAYRGLESWRRQLRGNTEYDLAKRALTHVYQLRDAFEHVRFPLMSYQEMPIDPAKPGEDLSREEREFRGFARAYEERWNKVVEASVRLEATLFEVEVLWGQSAKDAFTRLFELRGELLGAVDSELRVRNPKVPAGLRRAAEEGIGRRRQVLYGTIGRSEDPFRDDVAACIKVVESVLRPHLGRTS